MPNRSIGEVMDALDAYLDDFDAITRAALTRYQSYDPLILIELDRRAQAACTHCHMVTEADKRLSERPSVRPIEIKGGSGLKLWLLEDANAVIRFKKQDEDGRTRNYPTKQALKFDVGKELPGLPMPPVRLNVGYFLDETGSFVRCQVAKPESKKRVLWCASVVPHEERREGERRWRDETRQGRL
ncbi:MAG: hypothetical protein ACREDO_11925 [Methyloceanibacter sp.]